MKLPSRSVTVMEPSRLSLTVYASLPGEDVRDPAGSGGATSGPGGSRIATTGPDGIPASANALASLLPAWSTSIGSRPSHTAAASAPSAAAAGAVIAVLPGMTNGIPTGSRSLSRASEPARAKANSEARRGSEPAGAGRVSDPMRAGAPILTGAPACRSTGRAPRVGAGTRSPLARSSSRSRLSANSRSCSARLTNTGILATLAIVGGAWTTFERARTTH